MATLDNAKASQGMILVPFQPGGKHHAKVHVTTQADPVKRNACPLQWSRPTPVATTPMTAVNRPGHWVHLRTTRCRAVARIKDCWRQTQPTAAIGANAQTIGLRFTAHSDHGMASMATDPVAHHVTPPRIHQGVAIPKAHINASEALGVRHTNNTPPKTRHQAANSGANMGANPAGTPSQKWRSGRGSPSRSRSP